MKKARIPIAALVLSHAAFAADPVMEACGRPMDIFESSLRVILNKPATGMPPLSWRKQRAKVEAALALASWDAQYPGCLQGTLGESTWPQYNGVRALYKEFTAKYDYLPAQVAADAKSKLQVCKRELQAMDAQLANSSGTVSEKQKKQLEELIRGVGSLEALKADAAK